jgi:hypothetical protein
MLLRTDRTDGEAIDRWLLWRKDIERFRDGLWKPGGTLESAVSDFGIGGSVQIGVRSLPSPRVL